MPIPIEKILDSVKRAGFDTELRVAAAVQNAGWQRNQNVYFIDKDENKGRELDIRAYRIFNSIDEKPEINAMLNLCIEVKKTSEPFIFYANESTIFEGSRGYGIFNWSNNVNSEVLPYKDLELLRPFRLMSRVSRSYSSFKDGKTSHIQSGVLSAFKAAIHLKDNCDETYSDRSGDICFFIPMVVVEGNLYECYLNDVNEVTAEQVSELVYIQNYESSQYGRISQSVYVVTLDGFPKIMEEFNAWGESLRSVLMHNRNKIPGV